ncbi:MAG: sucrase ferredoxin [Leptolyngbyaceae cyanobacterium]
MSNPNISDSTIAADCRFCSVVSQNNGEDPIGTAGTYDRWLMVELPLPWTEKSLRDNSQVQQILGLVKELYIAGVRVRPMAIAPDREYSHPRHIRVLYYYRPAELFAQFEKQEFLVPDSELNTLITALLRQSEDLSQFATYRQDTRHIREILVCTHGNIDVACSRFGYPIYKKLRDEYADKAEFRIPNSESRRTVSFPQGISNSFLPLSSLTSLRVWRCSHFGGHQFAPTLVDLPFGRFWGHLQPEILATLIYSTGSVSSLRRFYRGWSGVSRFEQIVERELWMQYGWHWLNYCKMGKTLAIDTAHDEPDADWANVRIDFKAPNNQEASAYEARVEVCGEVMTQWKSGEEHPLKSVKQYQVTQLRRVV